MARGGGDDRWLKALGVLVLGVAAISYLRHGRGQANAPLVPDFLEEGVDRVVHALNHQFGHAWVTYRLDQLQAYLERSLPGAAAVLDAVYRVETAYPRAAGHAKKAAALRKLRGR